jgi:ribosome-binding protein aMBF1 (putative translation factor)
MLSKGNNHDYNSSFQDWTPIIIGNSDLSIENVPTDIIPKKKEYKITPFMATAIINARVSNQLSQKKVALLCSIPLNIIKNYENGIGMIDEKNLKKISTVLSVQLRKN